LVAVWLARRVASPMARLAEAAEALGRDLLARPLPVSGPREVAVVAAAFNGMQRRLVRLVHGRTQLAAAISHDLRTPLTQIRLRLEMTPASAERDKNLRALDDVDAIIGTFLAYARASHEAEERSRIDLGALVGSVCDDLADGGAAIECDCPTGLVVPCKRLAVKRAVTNLIENALKYGREARVSTRSAREGAVVSVEDRGPGIPPSQLEAVFEPFHRGGASGSADGRGVGLGLSIAQAIAEDHGGEVRLSNREEGGLRAELLLPR
jgi:signal transduction histidine kinase